MPPLFNSATLQVGAAAVAAAYVGSISVMGGGGGGVSLASFATRATGVAPLGVVFDPIDEVGRITGVKQPRGVAAQPATVTGVRVFRVEYGMPLGNASLVWNQSASTLSFGGGSAVTVSGNGFYTLPHASAGRSLIVFVTAAELSGTNQTETLEVVSGGMHADYSSFTWSWNFGDAGSGNYLFGRQNVLEQYHSKNTHTGMIGAHVYETPGTYTVTLTVTDDQGGVDQYVQHITPSAGTWTTYYVSATGNDSNDGLSPASPIQTLGAARAKVGTNVQILFKRGDTFTKTSNWGDFGGMFTKNIPGPGMVGAYGSGALPLIDCSFGVKAGFGGFSTVANDWRFVDLEVHTPKGAVGVAGGGYGGKDNKALYLRCKCVGGALAAGSDFDTGTSWKENVWADCDFSDTYSIVFYPGGKQTAIIGCRADISETTHSFRTGYLDKGLIAYNTFANPGPTRLAMKVHFDRSIRDNNPTFKVSHICVSDNYLQGTYYGASIACQDETYNDGLVTHVQADRNTITTDSTGQIHLAIGHSCVYARNNRIFSNGMSGNFTGVRVFSNPQQPSPNEIIWFPQLINNTIVHPDDNGTAGNHFYGINLEDAAIRGAIVKNNLLTCLDTAPVKVSIDDFSTGAVKTNNVYSTSDPGYANLATRDFRLLSSASTAINQGTSVLGVGVDYFENERDSQPDIGAFEATPFAPINASVPVVSGQPYVGMVLSASTGTWSASPAVSGYTYQWYLGAAAISGATASTYTVQAGDIGSTIKVRVTAINTQGSTSAYSSATSTVTDPPASGGESSIFGISTFGAASFGQ